jgi:hypothetical protein
LYVGEFLLLLSCRRGFYIFNLSFRPVNAIEAREGGEIVVSFADNLQSVQMKSAQLGSGPEKDGFTFDRVFPMGTKQHEVFDYGVKEYVLADCVCPINNLIYIAASSKVGIGGCLFSNWLRYYQARILIFHCDRRFRRV